VLLKYSTGLALLALGCAEKPASNTDSQAVARPTPTTQPVASGLRSPTWDPAFGNLVGYSAGDSAIVILLPSFQDARGGDTTYDASSGNGAKLDLFGESGFVSSSTVDGLGKGSEEEGCFEFSRGRLVGPPGSKWSVALPAGVAIGLPVHDLESMHGADSAALTDRILRLFGMIPAANDTAWRSAALTIEEGTRLRLSDAAVVAARVMRMLPGPQHYAQTYFLIAESASTEKDSADPNWRIAYVHPDRSNPTDTAASGLSIEDEVGVAAAVLMKADSMPVLMLETRGNEVNGYAALGRIKPAQWKVVWTGPHEGGC
jgi:hypothetical protein